MKRFWRYWLSVAATASMVATGNAQQGAAPGELGSYQSILNRAGINQGNHELPTAGRALSTTQNSWCQQGEGIGVNPNQVISGQPMYGAPATVGTQNSVMNSAPVFFGGTSCDGSGGYGGQSMIGSQDGYFDGGMAGSGAGSAANWVVGVRGLFFTRSGESPVPIARNAADDVLLSTVNDYGTMPGAETVFTRRTCNNWGAEFRYWGLYPNQRDYTFNGPGLDTYLTGLGDYLVAPGPTNVLTYFNGADNLRVYRNNEFHNVEVNGLRNGGCYTTLGGRNGTYEFIAGARWFQFNEDYRIAAFNAAATPAQINYDLATRNTLLGFQLGARNESCLTDRLSLIGGTRVGLFNNRSTASQSIRTDAGDVAYLSGNPSALYDFESERDSLAVLGELDMGVGYRFTQRLRATIGYRLIGVSGVALAPNQIPRNFTNNAEIYRVKSTDSLILSGGFAGLDMCF
jgi:hypothetical protein